ncbi:MAG: 16S rRNA (uracil(1498)-N(3))-methyltransferase [Nannocystaceae bacterium]|nr:16S rRNA (uracil(1498)-N(3))-methyltransferase [Nannocystaceae bacterium]
MSIRVFASPTQLGPLTLSAQESHYLVRVRRARVGSTLEVLHPEAGGWRAEVEDADTKQARVRVLERLPDRPAWPVDLAVAQPDTKAAQEVIARAVECGARSLTFLETTRSQPGRLSVSRTDRVVAAARRQCGRLDPLALHGPMPLAVWLATPRAGFIASLASDVGTEAPRGEIAVLIGPEGGLTSEEEALGRAAGLVPLSLGPFVLRTEVAVTAAVAVAGTILSV